MNGIKYSDGSSAEIVSRVYKINVISPESLETDKVIEDILLADTSLYDYIEFSGGVRNCVWVGRVCRNMINVMRPDIHPVFVIRVPYITENDKNTFKNVPRYDLWPWDYIIMDDGSGNDKIYKIFVYGGTFVDHVMTDMVDKIGD